MWVPAGISRGSIESDTDQVPKLFDPSVNETEPEVHDNGRTVAEIDTLWPASNGLGEEVRVVVEGVGLTVTENVDLLVA